MEWGGTIDDRRPRSRLDGVEGDGAHGNTTLRKRAAIAFALETPEFAMLNKHAAIGQLRQCAGTDLALMCTQPGPSLVHVRRGKFYGQALVNTQNVRLKLIWGTLIQQLVRSARRFFFTCTVHRLHAGGAKQSGVLVLITTEQFMPSIQFHRPSWVKNTPALNALTAKGALEADNPTISASQPPGESRPANAMIGRYATRVSLLRLLAKEQKALAKISNAGLLGRLDADVRSQVRDFLDPTDINQLALSCSLMANDVNDAGRRYVCRPV